MGRMLKASYNASHQYFTSNVGEELKACISNFQMNQG